MVVVAAAPSAATAAPKVLLLSGQPASGGRALPLMVPGPRAAGSEASGTPQARKRQRLTHLSPEEKALRRWARRAGLGRGAAGLGLGLSRVCQLVGSVRWVRFTSSV